VRDERQINGKNVAKQEMSINGIKRGCCKSPSRYALTSITTSHNALIMAYTTILICIFQLR
jgi:hypothetical protein